MTLPAKLQELYNSVRDYTDSRGRTLSTPFMKVPPRNVSYTIQYCYIKQYNIANIKTALCISTLKVDI